MNRWGGRAITKEEREEILRVYLNNPQEGCMLAVSKGLSQIYAYKLAHERGLLPAKQWPKPEAPVVDDPIIDRSPAQKVMRVNKLRAELLDLGYSVVKTDWLHSVLGGPVMEAAE